jgi:hypothetical protein
MVTKLVMNGKKLCAKQRNSAENRIKHQIFTVDDTRIKQQNIGYKPGVDYGYAIFFREWRWIQSNWNKVFRGVMRNEELVKFREVVTNDVVCRINTNKKK